MYEISKEIWHDCKLCGKNVKELMKLYGGSGYYYSEVFLTHLEKDHDISPENYFERFDKKHICCEECNKVCKIGKPCSSNLKWKKMCGRSENQKAWSEKAKTERKGSGNPMFGKSAWNKGLDATDPRVAKLADGRKGVKSSEQSRNKMSISANEFLATGKKRGMSGKKHSKESREKMSKGILAAIKRGVFHQLKSKPHLKMQILLDKFNICYEEEKLLSYWSFDFFLTDFNIYIEVDGDYFHSNPNTRWPNGPKTKTQIKNAARDKKKNKYCEKNNLRLIRFWEDDIMNHEEKVIKIICDLKK